MSHAPFHLLIATPQRILVNRDDIVALRAEDASGSFGLLPGHVDFLTVLSPSVVRWALGRMARATAPFTVAY